MRIFTSLFLFMILTYTTQAQATYTSANFAANGDTFYLTKAQPGNYNFETTGNNITWNYSSLMGISQKRLIYRLPTQTGFTAFQWPYIYNMSNVNLSSTDEQTITVLGLQQTNPNDYFLKNTSYLRQRASSYTVVVNNNSVNVKNVYTNADTIYKFPFTFNSTNASRAAYTINIPPNIYYRNVTVIRRDTVTGWGSVITPYQTYTNCLKYVSTVTQIDSVSANDTPVITNDTSRYREIKWFDPAWKTPVLTVKQLKIGSQYVTQNIEYLDSRQYYQPIALFAYVPVTPTTNDTVSFQNLSTNGYAYKWRFNDAISGGNDSSAEINPTHVFANAGTYAVQLAAYNGNLGDTFTLNVFVAPVNITYTFTGNGNWNDASNWTNNAIPPATLAATNTIVINPTAGGKCILNITQHIAEGASLTVKNGKELVVPGLLKVQ